MGEDVTATVFSREDRQRYRQKVRACLDVFARMLAQSHFDPELRSMGLEIELNLTDEAGDPALLNADVRQIGVGVSDFIPASHVQYTLFDDHSRKDKFRQTLHAIKERFGGNSLIRATELRPDGPVRDLIGFGSIKDLGT